MVLQLWKLWLWLTVRFFLLFWFLGTECNTLRSLTCFFSPLPFPAQFVLLICMDCTAGISHDFDCQFLPQSLLFSFFVVKHCFRSLIKSNGLVSSTLILQSLIDVFGYDCLSRFLSLGWRQVWILWIIWNEWRKLNFIFVFFVWIWYEPIWLMT